MSATRTLWFVLGDQLDPHFTVLRRHFDKARDVVLMAEVSDESRHVPSHKQRTILFLAAMRHYAERLRSKGVTVRYTRLDDVGNASTLAGELRRALDTLQPQSLAIVRPGEWRVLRMIERVAAQRKLPLRVHEDPHFLVTPQAFSAWANGRTELVMERFYRAVRKRFRILVTDDGRPEGGAWTLRAESRPRFAGNRPPLPKRVVHTPDATTRAVIASVERSLGDLPGTAAEFNWPVTREQALAELHDFVRHRLAHFGDDVADMATGAPWMHHSLLAAPLNLKLLDPREVVQLAVDAHRRGEAPLPAVEAFVRQVIGRREFIRGVYWHEGQDYASRNALGHRRALPTLYWSGETEMRCLREGVGGVLQHGFAHHAQRLLVTGNFALLAGVDPKEVSDWHLGMFVDGVDWATLPNALGSSQHADGGTVGTRAPVAGGRTIEKHSDYCDGCRFEPGMRTGDDACPMTTFYWDFLIRHQATLAANRRLASALAQVASMSDEVKREVTAWAAVMRKRLGVVER
ncbi:MAG: cryptochrome/photolyase family protein [Gemmatimonadaceae bacterium]|nr:cryptochrome/photolyase family protein [Gemmatimonadaceae bacterium]